MTARRHVMFIGFAFTLIALILATAQMAAAAPGAWKQVGPTGEWKRTTAATSLGGRMYTTEGSGGLYVTNVDTGTWKKLAPAALLATAATILAGIRTPGSATPEEEAERESGARRRKHHTVRLTRSVRGRGRRSSHHG